MNKSDIRRLSDACRSIIKEYGVVRDSCVQNRLNEFQTADKLQGYRDSLEALKQCGLIGDYNLRDLTVTILISNESGYRIIS